MGSKNNYIETNTKCICGNGDADKTIQNYFKNVCPNCNAEGKLQVETETNLEVKNNSDDDSDSQKSNVASNNQTPNVKIVCKNCRSEFCGQDGYDLQGGMRGSLTTVNPNDVSEDEDEEVSSTEENETTYMSGWEGLCDLLKPLDGQAMMVQRGDYVIIKKIEMPQTAQLWAYEGINVVDDSVTITDYTPEIYNTFVIKWGESFENELEFVINKHKQLFGERKVVLEAKKISVVDEESEKGEDGKEEEEDESDKYSVSESIFRSSEANKNLNNVDTSKIDTSNADLSDASSLGDSSGSDSEAPKTEEVPITTEKEAIQFGLTQVGKAKREDGHKVELKVIGNTNWQMGEWCHVRLPSFSEDSYMFISKCSFESSADSEYINTLTLVDYPPSLGKPKKTSNNDENKDDSESDTDTKVNNDENNDENNTNDSSNSDDNNSNNNSDNSSNS